MKPGSLTPQMIRVLEALARYHYLMPRQFTRLPGFSPHVEAVHKTLKRFFPPEKEKAKPKDLMIDFVSAGVDRELGKGRIPRLYYLTEHGAAAVASMWQCDLDSVFYPKGDKLMEWGVPHQALTNDFWIELDRFAGSTDSQVEFFHPYYRTTGANRNSKPENRLRRLPRIDFDEAVAKRCKRSFIIPDANFVLRTPQKRILCLLEACRGKDTKYVMGKLEWHFLALEHGFPSLKYGMETGNLILLVFETESAMYAVLKRLLSRQGIEAFSEFVACSTIDRLRGNFMDWWYVWHGEIKAGGLY